MAFAPPARHLLKAKDLADARYAEPLGVEDMAAVAGLSRAHFSREFRREFGESPHQYLLTRRMERAAWLLRATDRSVADVCFSVGLSRRCSRGCRRASCTRMRARQAARFEKTAPRRGTSVRADSQLDLPGGPR